MSKKRNRNNDRMRMQRAQRVVSAHNQAVISLTMSEIDLHNRGVLERRIILAQAMVNKVVDAITHPELYLEPTLTKEDAHARMLNGQPRFEDYY